MQEFQRLPGEDQPPSRGERHEEPLLLDTQGSTSIALESPEPLDQEHVEPQPAVIEAQEIEPTSSSTEDAEQSQTSSHVINQSNDGVFVNLNAKPSPIRPTVDETTPSSAMPPPSYDQAERDSVPEYSVHNMPARQSLGGEQSSSGAAVTISANNELLIDNIPVGSVPAFLFAIALAWFLPLIGFLIAVLVLGSHAALSGSRIGTGLWFISLSFTSSSASNHGADNDDSWDGFIRFVALLMGMGLVSQGLVEYAKVKRVETAIKRARSSDNIALHAVV